MTDPLRAAVAAQVALTKARAAARRGDLGEAARVLDELDAADRGTPAVLDLRARVHAQGGELSEADTCWRRVLELAPGDEVAEVAEAGRRAIAAIGSGEERARPVPYPGLVAAAAVVAIVAGAGVVVAEVVSAPAGADRAAAAAGTADALARERRRADELAQRIADEAADRGAAEERLAGTLDAVAAGLALPGVRVERRAADVRVLFEEGVFVRGTVSTATGRALLTELGGRLAGMPVRTTVVGHVVAVPGGRTSGGSVVALSRAQTAAEYLAQGGGLPLTAFSLVSAEQADGPFDDPERNRTVTLVITPGGHS